MGVMVMKVKLKNLGVLRQTKFELGDLTIICGRNNSGKTYTTYALFGFLYSWRDEFNIEIQSETINQILNTGTARIDLLHIIENYQDILAQACKKYSQKIPKIFAASEDRFKDTEFLIELDVNSNLKKKKYENIISSSGSNAGIFSLIKEANSLDLVITLLIDKSNVTIPTPIIKSIISNAMINIVFNDFFPEPFIASAERTGAAIFRQELNFAKKRLLEELNKIEGEIDRFALLFKEGYNDYALPIQTNVEFTRTLEKTAKKRSEFSTENQDILQDFADIIGGQYTVTKNDELYFIPTDNKKIKLTMDESSSAVRSLLDIGFYLKHIAKKGDLLMIDEPELNLHPENQRRIARLIAKLVNYGIKVFITTHSDYIVKELNTLIMLNSNKPHIKDIAKAEGYQDNELLDVNKIKAYVVDQDLIELDGQAKRKRCQTLIPADINQELGIEISSFDTAIETMNRIQEAIVWGGEM